MMFRRFGRLADFCRSLKRIDSSSGRYSSGKPAPDDGFLSWHWYAGAVGVATGKNIYMNSRYYEREIEMMKKEVIRENILQYKQKLETESSPSQAKLYRYLIDMNERDLRGENYEGIDIHDYDE